MYCIQCGAELSAGQALCPLCNTRVYHPDIPNEHIPTYPKKEFPSEQVNKKGVMFVLTIFYLIPLILPMLFELSYHREIDWSGYVTGGVILFYLLFLLPIWFDRPSPAIFVPVDFAAAALFLFYVNFATGGTWFFSFALPTVGVLGLIVSAAAILLYYLHHGRLYVVGGMLIALGLYSTMIELLVGYTFDISSPVRWSLFSLVPLFVLGLALILSAIIRPIRDTLYRIFFIGRG